MTTETTMIYITAGSTREAVDIGRAVVQARLAACANVAPSITSLYWWEGEVREEQEAALILKTRKDLVDRVIAKVKELHGDDCPCVVSLPIASGNDDFLKWIIKETAIHP